MLGNFLFVFHTFPINCLALFSLFLILVIAFRTLFYSLEKELYLIDLREIFAPPPLPLAINRKFTKKRREEKFSNIAEKLRYYKRLAKSVKIVATEKFHSAFLLLHLNI